MSKLLFSCRKGQDTVGRLGKQVGIIGWTSDNSFNVLIPCIPNLLFLSFSKLHLIYYNLWQKKNLKKAVKRFEKITIKIDKTKNKTIKCRDKLIRIKHYLSIC